MNIFFWAADEDGCGKYRCQLPAAGLRQLGHHVEVSTKMPLERIDAFDVIVGQRVSNEGASETWQRLAQEGRKLVYEVDDDLFRLHPSNPAYRVYSPTTVKQRLAANMRVASALTTTTPYLANYLRRFSRNAHVLPNVIDEALLDVERNQAETLTMGWAGSPTHHADFAHVVKPLKGWLRDNPSVGLHLVGTDYRKLLGRAEGRFTPWSTDLFGYYESLDFDFSFIPLAPHVFNRSKSDVKFLELSALGIPVVASNFGPYGASIEYGVTGYLASTGGEWRKYLSALADDEALRKELGQNAKQWAATRTLQGNAWRWAQVYASL